MITFQPNWLRGLPSHACNSEDAVRKLFRNHFKIERGDSSWANTVRGLANSGSDSVKVYKGVHQDKFGSGNSRDQVRVDQTHFNIIVQGRVCHVYVTPSLSGTYEITEVTNAPPVTAATSASPAPTPHPPGPIPVPYPIIAAARPGGAPAAGSVVGGLPVDAVLSSVLEMSGAFD